MATSLFFMRAEEKSVSNPNEVVMRKSGEIRREAQKSSRGRRAGSKTGQQNQKKQRLRGMGVAQLEQHIRAEEEKKMVGGETSAARPLADPVVVLQGFPSSGIFGVGSGHHQIMMDPVWGFVETSSTPELSSIPNHPQIFNSSCDTCFKKKRLDGHAPASFNPSFNEATNLMGFGSGNPRDGSGGVKEYYEFFPGKHHDFPPKTDSLPTHATSTTIDLSLKL